MRFAVWLFDNQCSRHAVVGVGTVREFVRQASGGGSNGTERRIRFYSAVESRRYAGLARPIVVRSIGRAAWPQAGINEWSGRNRDDRAGRAAYAGLASFSLLPRRSIEGVNRQTNVSIH